MSTRTEQAHAALVARLTAAASPALPAIRRNQSALDVMDDLATAQSALSVVDGEAVTENVLLGDPRTYELSAEAQIEWIVIAADDAAREAAFDAGVEAIHAAIEADATLGGAVDDAEAMAPQTDNLVTEGLPQIKAAIIPVRLTYTSPRPV